MKTDFRTPGRCLSAMFFLSVASAINAEAVDQVTPRLEEMTVTATRSARNLDELSRSVSIVTRQEI